MRTLAFAVATIAMLALSGCGSKPVTGTVTHVAEYAPSVSGTVTVTYHAKSGQNPSSGVPTANATTECAQNQVPGGVPNNAVPPCIPAYSWFNVTLTGLPNPGGLVYKLVLSGPTGTTDLGTPTMVDANTTVNKKFDADLTGKYTAVDLYLDDFHYATAPVAAGANTFALAPGVAGVTATGTFTDNAFDVTVTGIPANATLSGNLYVNNADGTLNPTPAESFAIPPSGTVHYEAKKHAMADFAEFHLHVGDSKLNLWKSKVTVNAE